MEGSFYAVVDDRVELPELLTDKAGSNVLDHEEDKHYCSEDVAAAAYDVRILAARAFAVTSNISVAICTELLCSLLLHSSSSYSLIQSPSMPFKEAWLLH